MADAKAAPPKEQNTSPAKPVHRFAYGTLSLSVFANERELDSGKTITVKEIVLERWYKTKDGRDGYTRRLRIDDLPAAAVALQQAFVLLKEDRSDA